jgi:tetratricopeptide (TPR) repeat protein
MILDEQMNDNESLLKDSHDAMELFPLEPAPYLFSGVANLRMKNYGKAIDDLLQGKDYVIDNKPLLAQFYSSLGDAYYKSNNYESSDEYYEKTLKIDPDNVYVLNNWAYYLSLRNENLEKAEKMSRRANEIEPQSSSYQDTYGWIMYRMGKMDEAKLWLEKALENNGTKSPVILEHYGDILFNTGEKDRALEYWKKARETGKGSDFLDKKISDKKLYE